MVNNQRRAELAITNLISHNREWNNCFNSVCFYTWNYSYFLVFNFTKRPEIDLAKTTASGKSHGMRAVCNLS